MDDLWEAASEDGDAIRRTASAAAGDAQLETVMPFLLAARSEQEFAHRVAMARGSLSAIAASCDVAEADLVATARRRFELLREAYAEGVDPVVALEPLLNGGGYGQGPEKPDEHDEGPDFSHGYSEVPAGPPGGPDPQVTSVRPPSTGPVQEATGRMRRHADASSQIPMPAPYQAQPLDTGTGPGSVDTNVASPQTMGMPASLPVGSPTASRDPVRRQVTAVARVIAGANPQLPPSECDRISRIVVGRYLREADLDGSVENNQPLGDGGGSSGGSSGGGGGGLGTTVEHGLAWKGLNSMMPGGGAAGAAGGEGAELGLAALAL
jgi:hypothetical protein